MTAKRIGVSAKYVFGSMKAAQTNQNNKRRFPSELPKADDLLASLFLKKPVPDEGEDSDE